MSSHCLMFAMTGGKLSDVVRSILAGNICYLLSISAARNYLLWV